ncbi:MAG: hypothetical protein KAY24_11810 [Candidatus Eisenbacteria sp.]|nr:hypothetical protein [Candidatus Eisenbacteria bacterium]
MKKLLIWLVLLGCTVSLASAESANLENGVFIAHYEAQIEYTHDPPIEGWCGAYAPFAISSAEEQVNRIDTSTAVGVVWYVLAAWDEDKEWCATQFGLGDYDARVFAFSAVGPCFPDAAGLEIPTAGWPAPNEGTACVVTGDAWTGNYVPVYYFTGYAYGYYGEEILQLTSDPSHGFGGWGNCLIVPTLYEATVFGGLGINTDGTYACPADPEAACCVSGECSILTQPECAALGGEWIPSIHECDPNPCPLGWPDGVCCIGGNCYIMTHPDCTVYGGQWFGDLDSCEPNPCPSATHRTRWGAIKAMYRE